MVSPVFTNRGLRLGSGRASPPSELVLKARIVSERFTRLEREVMAALAWDVRHLAPDLAGQFEESLPGARRNTGSGLFSEMIVSSRRPAPEERPTGLFGTVHAMVGDLPDPIAFRVELREGRLLALHGDAYGQDTRDLDFATVPFDQVFTVNDQGKSIEFDPAVLLRPSPLLALQVHGDPLQAELEAPPTLVNRGPLQRLQEEAPDVLHGLLAATSRPASDAASTTSVLVGLWVVAAVIGLLAIVLGAPPILVGVAGVWLAHLLRNRKVREALTRAAATLGRYEVRPSGS